MNSETNKYDRKIKNGANWNKSWLGVGKFYSLTNTDQSLIILKKAYF